MNQLYKGKKKENTNPNTNITISGWQVKFKATIIEQKYDLK